MASTDDDKKTPQDPIATHEPSIEPELGESKEVFLKDADPALALTGGEQIIYTPEEERSVLSKIDWHILPLMCWVYALQFADKISLNYASLMGIKTDAHLNPNSQEYSWVSSIFYAGYIFWEYVTTIRQVGIDRLTVIEYRFPTTYLVRRLPIAKYTSINIVSAVICD